ncbi:phosphotransferase system, HPr-related protein [Pseudomonas putida]|uniref:phosphotransferase system, HPr-related protein n=1 Tax=Pseudomonas TaxID=286 RepID=UPI00105AA949|nr:MULTISPECIES: phosphotransferase system, HPr-related protein [Pseudomonas]MBF8745302.1 phosphotransferase system, HPr-related protein [Pseudomonas monteilii]MCT8163434.1 phosphotransferase system, HPr-related protein [Pseudomonas sp. HD6422]MCT8182226.1 phosphotransferase system, HPr-related protein [Pseudomonas sp. HD6421]TDJ79235.1 phosphotransferase system, HPr-related protein [Pseudomonas putida]
MSRPDDPKTYVPSEIDDTEDRMGSVHELDFSERNDERQGRAGDERPAQEVAQEFPSRRVAESGMTGGEALSDSLHEDNVTYDDLSPDTLLDETGARDPHEPGGAGGPADKRLRRVDAEEIGGGIGLDEAELARSAPLDGEPWSDDVIDEEGSTDR